MHSLERLTYVCLIIVCLISGFFIVKDRVRPHAASSMIEANPAQSLLGKPLTVDGAEWRSSKLSVVLFLSTSCHFCEASVPFYSRLLSEHERDKSGVKSIVAISGEPSDKLNQHFDAEHLHFDKTYQIPLPNGLLQGTPTLMMVDENGVIQLAAVGQLSPTRENDILRIVRTGDIGASDFRKGGIAKN